MQANKPYAIERILSVASYLTAGWVGAIWLIIAALAKKRITPFLMYHILQSIFLSLTYFVILIMCRLLDSIIAFIPIVRNIPLIINWPLPFAFNLSAIELFTTTIILYLVITSFMGYYSYLPWISDVVKGQTRN